MEELNCGVGVSETGMQRNSCPAFFLLPWGNSSSDRLSQRVRVKYPIEYNLKVLLWKPTNKTAFAIHQLQTPEEVGASELGW